MDDNQSNSRLMIISVYRLFGGPGPRRGCWGGSWIFQENRKKPHASLKLSSVKFLIELNVFQSCGRNLSLLLETLCFGRGEKADHRKSLKRCRYEIVLIYLFMSTLMPFQGHRRLFRVPWYWPKKLPNAFLNNTYHAKCLALLYGSGGFTELSQKQPFQKRLSSQSKFNLHRSD